MTPDRSFIELNRASTDRIRDLAAGLTDEALQNPVGGHWTVAITLAHLAWWDGRVSYVLDMTERNGALFVPQIDLIVNDLSLPFWAAIPPRGPRSLPSQPRKRWMRGWQTTRRRCSRRSMPTTSAGSCGRCTAASTWMRSMPR